MLHAWICELQLDRLSYWAAPLPAPSLGTVWWQWIIYSALPLQSQNSLRIAAQRFRGEKNKVTEPWTSVIDKCISEDLPLPVHHQQTFAIVNGRYYELELYILFIYSPSCLSLHWIQSNLFSKIMSQGAVGPGGTSPLSIWVYKSLNSKDDPAKHLMTPLVCHSMSTSVLDVMFTCSWVLREQTNSQTVMLSSVYDLIAPHFSWNFETGSY